jgi:hypothetical protein
MNRLTRPQPGDLLIARDTDERNTYTLSVVPGPPQLRYTTYEVAIVAATAWGRRERLSVWVTEDGGTFTAVEPARQPTPPLKPSRTES